MPALKYSPRVARTLAKGADMTLSDMKYLFDREVPVEDIKMHTGFSFAEINQIRKNVGGAKAKIRPGKASSIDLFTMEAYKKLKEVKLRDSEIAEYNGFSISVLTKWKIANGLIKPNMRGLTVEKYIEHRKNGMLNGQIAKKYKIAFRTLGGWLECNFTEEQLQEFDK